MAAWLRLFAMVATVFVALLASARAMAIDASSLAAALALSPAPAPLARESHPSHARPEQREDGRKGGVGRAAAEGPRPNEGGQPHHWASDGMLQGVELPDGRWVEFRYDPFARRLLKRVGRSVDGKAEIESETKFVWDGDVLVHEVRSTPDEWGDGSTTTASRTFLFNDTDFAPMAHREASGEWIQYLNDPAGAPDALVDARGNVACEYERTVWGYGQARPGARATTPVRFQGQYADEETGLSYNRYRYVLGETQDFCSSDPLGLGGGANEYGRVPNPFGWADPLGLARDCSREPGPARPAVEGDPWSPAEVEKRRGTIAQPNGPLGAQALGYEQRISPQRAPFDSHGQEVYSNGRNYITPDADSHSGGVWKMFDRRGNRLGTYDADLNRIGK